MALTKMIVVRVDGKMAGRIRKEVSQLSKTGRNVVGADITREALIEYFARKDAERIGK